MKAIREKCVTTSLSILPLSPSVSRFYEKLVYNNLSNKTNWRARATALQLFSASLPSLPPTTSLLQTKVGKTSLNLSIQLLADANQEVRSYALEVIISLYACEPQGVKNMLGKQKGGVVRPAMKKELEEVRILTRTLFKPWKNMSEASDSQRFSLSLGTR